MFLIVNVSQFVPQGVPTKSATTPSFLLLDLSSIPPTDSWDICGSVVAPLWSPARH